MVTDKIVSLLLGLLRSLVALLPEWTPDLPSWAAFGTFVGNAFGQVQNYFPVATLGLCVLAIVGMRLFLTAWGLLVFVYDRLPFKAT